MTPLPLLLAALALLTPQMAAAVTCQNVSYEDTFYTICEVDAATDDLRLFLRDGNGDILGQFSDVSRSLADGETLAFAMNAGMYHADRTPVGHYVENGEPQTRLLTGPSNSNFGLLPNGVFCISAGRVDVFETLEFARRKPDCISASQSGPMLVIHGQLHHRFLPDSTSRHVRNGVGVSDDGRRVVFAISNETVTFHQFGRFFRDALGTPNALYFDGKISRLHAPQLDRSDSGFWMGPIVGVVVDE